MGMSAAHGNLENHGRRDKSLCPPRHRQGASRRRTPPEKTADEGQRKASSSPPKAKRLIQAMTSRGSSASTSARRPSAPVKRRVVRRRRPFASSRFRPVKEHEILHDGGGGRKKKGTHRRHRGGQRTDERHARRNGIHVVRDQVRHHGIRRAAHFGERRLEDAAGEDTQDRHADHERAADDGRDYHGLMQVRGATVAHAAHGRLGKPQRPEAPQAPRRKGEATLQAPRPTQASAARLRCPARGARPQRPLPSQPQGRRPSPGCSSRVRPIPASISTAQAVSG